MTEIEVNLQEDSVQERLLKAAFDLFLHENYNKVTTRMLAREAKTSLSMIRFYRKWLCLPSNTAMLLPCQTP